MYPSKLANPCNGEKTKRHEVGIGCMVNDTISSTGKSSGVVSWNYSTWSEASWPSQPSHHYPATATSLCHLAAAQMKLPTAKRPRLHPPATLQKHHRSPTFNSWLHGPDLACRPQVDDAVVYQQLLDFIKIYRREDVKHKNVWQGTKEGIFYL